MRTALKIAVVGCGDVSRLYFPGLRKLADTGKFEIVAVCDVVEDKAKKGKQELNASDVYVDYDKMLQNNDIDVVVNLTPIQVHASVTMKAIKAGKNVYTEKPLATTLEEADEIIKTAKEMNVKVASAPPLLLHPVNLKLKDLIEKKAVGKVCFVKAKGSNPGPAWITEFSTDPSWFYEKDGGPLFDLAVYPLQLITGLLGPAQRVVAFAGVAVPHRTIKFGEAKGKEITVEALDNIQIMLDFGEARFATIDATYCELSAKVPFVEIYGDEGTIYCYSRPNQVPMEIFRVEDSIGLRGWLTPEPVYWGTTAPLFATPSSEAWSFAEGPSHLIRCVAENRDPLISATHARHVLEIILKTIESAEVGKVLSLTTTFPAIRGGP